MHPVPLLQPDITAGTQWGASFPIEKRDNGTSGGIAQVALSSEFDAQIAGLKGLARRHCLSLMRGRKQFGPIDWLNVDVKDTVLDGMSVQDAIDRFNIQIPTAIDAEFYAQTLTTWEPGVGRKTWFVGWVRGDAVKILGRYDAQYDHWRVPIISSAFPDELFKIFDGRYPNV